jgi:hypothetical protein
MRKNVSIFHFLKVLLLMFFIGHYASITLFYHTHEIDGQLYCHSHFFLFDKDDAGKRIPLSSHSHTPDTFNLIRLFNKINFVNDLELPCVTFISNVYVKIETIRLLQSIILPAQFVVGLRAPPAC